MTDHLFIVNPKAGKADRTERITQALRAIGAFDKNASGDNVTVYTTKSPGDAAKAVCAQLRTAQNPTRVYACGGDGTLNEVAQGVYLSGNKTASLGVIPTGSGNDFLRSFAIPESRFRSLSDMMRGETVPCDLLVVTDDDGAERVCVNIASAGFDAAVCRGQEKFKRVPLMTGPAAYKLSLAQQFTKHLGHSFQVLADGEPIGTKLKGEYMFALGANGNCYGGGFRASPESKTNDGVFELILIERLSRATLCRAVNDYRKGTYFDKLAKHMVRKRVTSMQILSEKPLDMNLDGEMVTMRNPRISILPAALQLILPA